MKKLTAFLLVLTALVFNCVSVFAAETNKTSIEITSAKQNEDKTIDIIGNVANKQENQIITVMATELVNNTYDPNSIVYIDQIEDGVNQEGSFTVKFMMSSDAVKGKTYILRVGGSNIDTPQEKKLILIYDESGEAAIIYGDIDGQDGITANDASILLEYVKSKNNVELNEYQLKAAAVTGDSVLTANDASYILKKALDGSFVFPVQKNNN